MRPSALLISSILLLGACADRATLHVLPEAKEVGTIHEIYVATNRGRRAEDGAFDESRSETTSFLKAQVSVPPSHEAGRTQTNARNPNPERDFVIAAQTELRSKPTFQSELRKSLASHPSADRDVTLFVHGYNTSYSEGLFRLAQVDHDMQPPGVSVLFSWPSAAQIVGYANDHDSMIFSRDALQDTLFSVSQVAPKRTLLVAHSMGAMLTMETLRQIEIERPGWSKRNLQGVVLISPDIDIDVFHSQLARIPNLPQPFVVFVSQRDRALEISELVNGRPQRLGRESDIEQLRDYPILVIDVTEFSNGRGGDHFTVGSSAELMEFLSDPQLEQAINSQVFGNTELRASGQLLGSTLKRAENAVQWILFPQRASD
ncbi:alpha/beta hydrolase [Cognatishimia activa]|uniref:Alpha/beta hydrolase n=1 Tax=Cognatishimia activa TaxID=1715691 RepID=A0A975ESN9_9RHOB|nr:alpha/beta fold hydrolase [Cognatishimia activa]QTN37102.1 alpha/beta hydrolase [Cognatishimia activa]